MRQEVGVLILAFLIGLFMFADAQAQPRTVTCPDGSIVALSPFNAHDPCRLKQPPVADDVDPSFVLLFGPAPEPTGDSRADKLARVQYEQDRRLFGGVIDPPDPEGYRRVQDTYLAAGWGGAVFYRMAGRDLVRWPFAPLGPATAIPTTAVLSPGLVISTYYARKILGGACVEDQAALGSSFVPGWVQSINQRNCEAAQ